MALDLLAKQPTDDSCRIEVCTENYFREIVWFVLKTFKLITVRDLQHLLIVKNRPKLQPII